MSNRNYSIDILSFRLIFKIAKDKMPLVIADFALLQVFADWCQNIPKWAGKLWSLIVKTLNFDWPAEHVFVTCVDKVVANDNVSSTVHFIWMICEAAVSLSCMYFYLCVRQHLHQSWHRI